MGERVSQRAGAVSTEQRGAARSYRQCTAGKAARGAPNRIGLFAWLVQSNVTKSAPHLSFTTFCRPKISQAQNGFPRLTRLVFRRRLPVQHIAWTAFLLPARLFPTVARQSATQLPHTTFSHLSPSKDHLLPARFRSHFRPVSRLYIAVLPLWPSSLPPQASCRRYNPSNAALPSTVRLLPGAHAKKVYAERA